MPPPLRIEPYMFGHEEAESLLDPAAAAAGIVKHDHATRSEVVSAGEAFGWVILVIGAACLAVGMWIWGSKRKKSPRVDTSSQPPPQSLPPSGRRGGGLQSPPPPYVPSGIPPPA